MKKIERNRKPDYNSDIMEDDDRMYTIKRAIETLRPMERKIFLTYADTGKYTETAKIFHVSIPTIRKYINEIREKIYDYIFNDALNRIDNHTDL